jgi:paraquat-inducible protein B
MTPRPNAARVGLFTLGGLALLFVAVVVVFGGRLFAQTERAVLHFSGSVYGLQVGAAVVFRGVRLGSVKSIGIVLDGDQFAVPVVVELDRERIRLAGGGSAAQEPKVSLAALVERGLTGQLATQSLLTGQLYVDLDLRPTTKAEVRRADGLVEIPTAPTRFQSLQDQLDRVDLAAMSADLGATLAATRGLVSGPEIRQTLAELAQASAALARLAANLDKRAPALANAAQGTLAQAARAASSVGAAAERLGAAGERAGERVGSAAESVGGAASRVGDAAQQAQQLLAPGSPVLASVQQAADELGRSAAALREATASDSASVQSVQRAMGDVSRAARSVRELADLIEQQPQSLIRGRSAAP